MLALLFGVRRFLPRRCAVRSLIANVIEKVEFAIVNEDLQFKDCKCNLKIRILKSLAIALGRARLALRCPPLLV